ncbi:MAG: GTPase Era [Spirochaetales bacterium]|jgi:GTPase|nr:GTPase Era [Spirochaetales bacterium]
MTKCATVSIIGRPSSGKSTFINSICEAKVSITSSIPQTTRNTIKGIYTDTRGQIIFLDTPGIHNSEANLNLKLMEVAKTAIEDCDAILYMIDPKREPGAEENMIVSILSESKRPIVLCINKKDIATDSEIERAKEFLKTAFPSITVHPLCASALEDDGLDEILIALFATAPEGPLLYSEDTRTDQDLEFRISEIIREKTISNLKEELPHSLFVEIADLQYDKAANEVWIRAFINVEHESQKGIIVGKGGTNIRRIRIASFSALKHIFPSAKLQIDLRVKTAPRWRQNEILLKKMIK